MAGLALVLAGCFGEIPVEEGESTGAARSVEGDDPTTTQTTRKNGTAPARAANETGLIMVLEYHRVEEVPRYAPEWTISPRDLRKQLEYLHHNDYHPVNFRDLVQDKMDVPAGKTPVVLTFDDSSDSQFTMVREGGEWAPDPEGAVGVLQSFHRDNPDWPMRATFFVLPEAQEPNNLFGQPELAGEKLRYLDERGMEIGAHTLYHANLAQSSPEEVRRQLALSVKEIRGHLPGYSVDTLSLPFGEYPQDIELLKSGEWEGHSYELSGAAEVSGGASHAPDDDRFDPYRVPRIQAEPSKGQFQEFIEYFEENPSRRYVSSGE